MTLVLVRHAEPADDARGRCYGSLDVGLSSVGERQAGLLATALASPAPAVVVSSPRRRALTTARQIARPHRLRVEVLEGLRELDFGAFEGRTYDEIAQTDPELYAVWMTNPTRVRFPGGESYHDLSRRALATVETLRERAERSRVVAVTHAGFVRAVLVDLLGMPEERVFRLTIPPASVTTIEWVEGEPLVGPVAARVLAGHT